jgi:hypothetical protein
MSPQLEWIHKKKWNGSKFWNGDQAIENQNFFPPRPISGPTLDPWLNRKTLWWQVHTPMHLHLFFLHDFSICMNECVFNC